MSPAVQKFNVLSSLVLSFYSSGGFSVNSGISPLRNKIGATGDSLQKISIFNNNLELLVHVH